MRLPMRVLFLKKHFPAYDIIEVDMKEIYRLARPLKRSRHPEDIVCMIGGGNMGIYTGTKNGRDNLSSRPSSPIP